MSATMIHRPMPRLALGLILAAFAGGSVLAQPAGQGQGSAEAQQARKEIQEAQKRVRDLQQQVGEIRESALKSNPELEQQRGDLRDLMKEKMKAEGHKPDEKLSRLKELRTQLQEGDDLSQQEQQELRGEYQKVMQSFRQAQQKTLKDPEVQKAREQFSQDLQAAMKEEDPQAEELMQELDEARKDFREKIQNRLGNMKQGQGQGRSGGGAQQ